MEKRDLIGEIKEKTDVTIIKQFNSDGAMLQYNSSGEFKGKYHANHVDTIDVNLRIDGTNEWESRGMEITKEGDVVMITGKGTGRMEASMQGTFSGEVTYMTASPRLSWLNNSKGWVEGITNLKNNESIMRIYAEKPRAAEAVVAPAPAM